MARTQTKAARTARKTSAKVASKVEAGAERTAAAAEKMADKAETAFAMTGVEMPEFFRTAAEQGFAQTRDTYSKFKSAAAEATDVIEDSMGKSREGVLEVQRKSLELGKDNADATFELAHKLLGVTSLTDALQLQAEYLRERFDTMVGFSKDMTETCQKVADEAARPAKTLFERTVAH